MRIGKVRFKWSNSWRDKKTGKTYTKYRPPGCKAVTSPTQSDRLSSSPPTLSFDVAAAVADKGTVRSTIERYMAKGSAFNALGVNTRMRQASTLNRFSAENGDKPFALLDRKYLERLFASAPTPGSARTCWITLRLAYAVGHVRAAHRS